MDDRLERISRRVLEIVKEHRKTIMTWGKQSDEEVVQSFRDHDRSMDPNLHTKSPRKRRPAKVWKPELDGFQGLSRV